MGLSFNPAGGLLHFRPLPSRPGFLMCSFTLCFPFVPLLPPDGPPFFPGQFSLSSFRFAPSAIFWHLCLPPNQGLGACPISVRFGSLVVTRVFSKKTQKNKQTKRATGFRFPVFPTWCSTFSRFLRGQLTRRAPPPHLFFIVYCGWPGCWWVFF